MGAVRFARWVTLVALFSVPFLALALHEAFYFPFVTARGFAFRLIVEAAFAGWLVMAAGEPKYRPRASWVAVLFALLVAWMALADVLAVDPHKAFWSGYERMDGWVSLAHVFALFVIAGCVLGTDALWMRWWLAFVLASGLVCAEGALQIARLLPAPAWPRVDAGFGNPEFLASYLLFALPATLWLALDAPENRRRLWRGGLLALAALQLVILGASGTRGAYVGLVAGAAVGAALWLRQIGRARWAAVAAAAPVLALVAAVSLVRTAPTLANSAVGARLTEAGLGELRIRFTLWRMAWEGFIARPITGWGHEGFTYVFYRFYSPSLTGGVPWYDRAHSLYFDWLVAGGAPALLLFLGLLLSAGAAIARGPFPPHGRILLLSALAAYAVQGLVVFDNLFSYVPLAAVLALAHSGQAGPRTSARVQAASAGASWVGGACAAAGLAAAVSLLVLPGLRANLDLNRVLDPPSGQPVPLGYFKRALDDRGFAAAEICEKLAQAATAVADSDAPDPEKAAFQRYAIARTQIELAHEPQDARLRLALAALYRRLGDLKAARAEIEAALRMAPNNPLILQERDLEQAGPAAAAPASSF